MFNVVYLSLGSNIGDRYQNLQDSLELLEEHRAIQIRQSSSVYETLPVGYTDQPLFLNMVTEIGTLLTPEELLQVLQEIELKCGRIRDIRWGPRTIDLDILLYNSINMQKEHLIIPHPRMKERAFVLEPLAEIAPELIIPGESKSVSQLVRSSKGVGVHKWMSK